MRHARVGPQNAISTANTRRCCSCRRTTVLVSLHQDKESNITPQKQKKRTRSRKARKNCQRRQMEQMESRAEAVAAQFALNVVWKMKYGIEADAGCDCDCNCDAACFFFINSFNVYFSLFSLLYFLRTLDLQQALHTFRRTPFNAAACTRLNCRGAVTRLTLSHKRS